MSSSARRSPPGWSSCARVRRHGRRVPQPRRRRADDDVDGNARPARARRSPASPIVALAPAPAQDANTFVVTRTTAERLDAGRPQRPRRTSTAGSRSAARPSARPGRSASPASPTSTGCRFDEFVGLDAGGPLTRQALREGDVDVGLLFTTDPVDRRRSDLVELADDRGLQPAENVTPLVRAELVDRWGDDVVDVIDAVSARLTTEAVRDLNRGRSATTTPTSPSVVAAWWAEVRR